MLTSGPSTVAWGYLHTAYRIRQDHTQWVLLNVMELDLWSPEWSGFWIKWCVSSSPPIHYGRSYHSKMQIWPWHFPAKTLQWHFVIRINSDLQHKFPSQSSHNRLFCFLLLDMLFPFIIPFILFIVGQLPSHWLRFSINLIPASSLILRCLIYHCTVAFITWYSNSAFAYLSYWTVSALKVGFMTYVFLYSLEASTRHGILRDTCTPRFIAALFIIARTWKQPRCPSADEWIRELWYIYTMEYYSAIKKNSFESLLMRWMKLEPIIQSEVSQKDKDHYNILTHIYGI